MSRYLIINAHSSKNVGDFAIVSEMIKMIRANDEEACISVSTNHVYKDAQKYESLEVEAIAPLFNYYSENGYLMRYLSILKSLIRLLFLFWSREYKMARDYDYVISAGGGYLYSSPKGPMGIGLLAAALSIYVYSFFARIIVMPVSVGPINYKVDDILVMTALRRSHSVFSRESYSDAVLNASGIKFVESLDIVFNDYQGKIAGTISDRPKTIGLTAIDFRFARPGTVNEDVDVYLSKLANSLNRYFDIENGLAVKIFVHVDVSPVDTDRIVSEKLKSLLRCKSEIVNLSHMELNEIYKQYKMVDLFIASRMHSAILAINAGIPCISISYQPKCLGTFKRLGLSKYAIDISNLNEDWLLARITDDVPATKCIKSYIDTLKKEYVNAIEP